jgi:hypothetical protein
LARRPKVEPLPLPGCHGLMGLSSLVLPLFNTTRSQARSTNSGADSVPNRLTLK